MICMQSNDSLVDILFLPWLPMQKGCWVRTLEHIIFQIVLFSHIMTVWGTRGLGHSWLVGLGVPAEEARSPANPVVLGWVQIDPLLCEVSSKNHPNWAVLARLFIHLKSTSASENLHISSSECPLFSAEARRVPKLRRPRA